MEQIKDEWEIMPYTGRDGKNIRWVKAIRGKKSIPICTTFSPHAEAHARFIAAAPKTKRQRDKLLEACKEAKALLYEVAEMNIQPFPFSAVALNRKLIQLIAEAETK